VPLHYTLQFAPGVEMREDDRGILLVSPFGALRVRSSPGFRRLLDGLARGGLTRDGICDDAIGTSDDGGAGSARFYFALAEIERKGFVRYSIAQRGRPFATLEPLASACRFDEIAPDATFRLSRFACVRRVDQRLIVESPLGYARVVLHHSDGAALLARLATPHTVEALSAAVAELDEATVAGFAGLLVMARAAGACNAAGRLAEDDDVPLLQWEFHDLMFHSRSRLGRHNHAYGGTFRFIEALPSLPAVKPPIPVPRLALYKPDLLALEAIDLPFTRVTEARRSLRTQGTAPLTAEQLGEFLYRTARVQQMYPASRERGVPIDVSMRPAASGGASHELELYLVVSRCTGIQPGLYHYDPLAHELEVLAGFGVRERQLLDDACVSAATDSPPDVLITCAARFQRVSWKYESIAYAIMLKNAGALYQQMYLVATAMNLAPCGLGGGNSDLFAEAAGLDYYAETSVGEFMLSSR
jgi:SagB-type dehydrogenase family enzyme